MYQHVEDFLTIRKFQKFGEIDLRPLFGGLGLYRNGRYFGIVANGKLYLRTTAETVGKYLEAKMQPLRSSECFSFQHTYEVPSHILDDETALYQWVEEAYLHTSDANPQLQALLDNPE